MEQITVAEKRKKVSVLFLKNLAIFIANIIIPAFFGYYLWQIIDAGAFNAYPYLIIAAILLALLFYLTAISAPSFKTTCPFLLIMLLFSCCGWFINWQTYLQNIKISLAAFLIAFLLLLLGNHKIKGEVKNLVKIKWWRIGKSGLRYFFWAMIIIMSVSIYFSPQTKLEVLINESHFNKILDSSRPIIKFFIPDFNWNSTVDGFIKKQIEKNIPASPSLSREDYLKKLAEMGVPLEYAYVKKNGSTQLQLGAPDISAATKQYKDSLSLKLGFKITGSEKLNELAYKIIFSEYRKLSDKAKNYASIGLIIVIALTVKTLAIILEWLTLIFGFFVYELLISSGFFKIKTENVLKEKISL